MPRRRIRKSRFASPLPRPVPEEDWAAQSTRVAFSLFRIIACTSIPSAVRQPHCACEASCGSGSNRSPARQKGLRDRARERVSPIGAAAVVAIERPFEFPPKRHGRIVSRRVPDRLLIDIDADNGLGPVHIGDPFR